MVKKVGLLLVLCWCAQVCSAQGAAAPVAVVPITKEPSHHLVFENEYVRVFKVEVAPHAETLYHKHDVDYVFVTLGDSDVESVRVGEQPVRLQLKDGDTRFTKGGFAHKAVNKSDKPFRNVTVELKKSMGQLDCGTETQKQCAWSVAMIENCHTPIPLLIASNLTISLECIFKTRHRTLYSNALYIRTKTERVPVSATLVVKGTGKIDAAPVKESEIEIKWFKQDSEAVFDGEPNLQFTYVVLSFPRTRPYPSFKSKNKNK